jgi:hypothetical protein
MDKKRWYERFEWNKVSEPFFRWAAIVAIAAMAPSATAIFANNDSIPVPAASGEMKKAYTPSVQIDSLGKCLSELKEDVAAIRGEMRTKKSIDSAHNVMAAQQYTFMREDISDIKRFLMGRNFASR